VLLHFCCVCTHVWNDMTSWLSSCLQTRLPNLCILIHVYQPRLSQIEQYWSFLGVMQFRAMWPWTFVHYGTSWIRVAVNIIVPCGLIQAITASKPEGTQVLSQLGYAADARPLVVAAGLCWHRLRWLSDCWLQNVWFVVAPVHLSEALCSDVPTYPMICPIVFD